MTYLLSDVLELRTDIFVGFSKDGVEWLGGATGGTGVLCCSKRTHKH